MKIYFFYIILLFSVNISGQGIQMFDTLQVDSNTKLIGFFPKDNDEVKGIHWDFCIDKPGDIKKVMRQLTIGKEVLNFYDYNYYSISLIQNHKVINTWEISPTMNSARKDGHNYEFKLKQIRKIRKSYPFDYKTEKRVFKTIEEYNYYLAEQKLDKKFLFAYAPHFQYEGSFEIQFLKTDSFSSPKAIWKYLKPLIEEIVNEGEYNISYILNETNWSDNNQFTMTISCSK